MGDPELRSDETILIRSNGIFVKSIPFEGILTNKRILLVDRAKDLLPPKEIPLATIKDVDTGENAIRDQTITISIIAKTGETRQMILTFSRQVGGNRIKERNEWVKYLKERTTSTFEQAIRKVIPGMEQKERRSEAAPAPRIEIVNSPIQDASRPSTRSTAKKEIESVQPVKRIIETGPVTPSIPIMTREPEPAPEPASPGFGLFCSRCGNKVMEGSAFCNRCGSQIVAPGKTAAREERPVVSEEPPFRTIPGAEIESPEENPSRERPTISIPSDPVRDALSEKADSEAPEFQFGDEQRAPVATRAPAQKTKKSPGKPLIPRLFSPKELSPTPLNPKSMPTAPASPPKKPRKPKKSAGWRPGRRTVIAIGVIVLLAIVVVIGTVFLYPLISKMVTTTPGSATGTGNTPVPTGVPGANPTVVSSQTIVPRATTPSTAPATGVFVHINYLGSWKGTYGMQSDPQVTADSGDRFYEVLNATGTVQASIAKLDSSTKHDLLVEIYKNGKLLTSGTTSAPYGSVILSVNINTSVAQPPKTSGGAAPTATKAPAGAGNTTVTATTITTVKTTAPTK